MAVHTFDSSIDGFDSVVEPVVDRSRCVSSPDADGAPEINLGAFRGLAFALILETVLVIFVSLAWQIWHVLR